jgi:hypothetical protein
VEDAAVTVIAPSDEVGCQHANALTIGKSSQIFSAEGGDYIFHSINGGVYLAHMSDAERSATALRSMCVLEQPATQLADLDYGESMQVIDGRAAGLLLSDTAIARRSDGTWVLFVKGIRSSNTCSPAGSLCELCSRAIYRATSSDLVTWSALEQVVEQASVPEAVSTADGEVWLYWQDFSQACAEQDQMLAAVAPISGASEEGENFSLSETVTVRFADEAFQSDASLHFATNANPVALMSEEDRAALSACVNAE